MESEKKEFFTHLAFNPTYFNQVRDDLIEVAEGYGLVFEVLSDFCKELERRFNSNDYPLTLEGYIEVGNHALYEWDI